MISARIDHPEIALERAIRDCDAPAYFALIAQDADPLAPRYRESLGMYGCVGRELDESYLTLAAKSGCAAIVEHMLSWGANVNAGGWPTAVSSPLMAWVSAVQISHPECNVKRTGELLMAAGADPDLSFATHKKSPDHGSARWLAWLQKNSVALGLFAVYDAQVQSDQLNDDTPAASRSSPAPRL